jgi:SWI/SNF-related matrix-associated actin-dependent regulator of chromatin subfamily A member 5
VEGKTLEEVTTYSAVFWQRVGQLANSDRIVKGIEVGEAKLQRQSDVVRAVERKLEQYANPARDLRLAYGGGKGKTYTEEEDRFLLCSLPSVGYGNWDQMKAAVRKHWLFRFDWFFKSRTPAELGRRVDALVRLIEKEQADADEKEAVRAGRPLPPRPETKEPKRKADKAAGGEGGGGGKKAKKAAA